MEIVVCLDPHGSDARIQDSHVVAVYGKKYWFDSVQASDQITLAPSTNAE